MVRVFRNTPVSWLCGHLLPLCPGTATLALQVSGAQVVGLEQESTAAGCLRQKLYPEDLAFGASTFPHQYLSSEMALHPYTHPPYPLESTHSVCPVPGSQYDYSQPSRYRGSQTAKPRYEHGCPLPQDTKAPFKKKTYDEQKFANKKADGTISSDIKPVKGSHYMSYRADTNLKSDGYHKRTDKKPRISEKCGPPSKPGFEFTRLDFPKLQGAENSEILETPKQPKWGPSHSASTDTSLGRGVGKPAPQSAEGETVVEKNKLTDSVTDNAATSPSSCTRELSWTPMGYVVRQTLPTEPPPVPRNVTSVINLKTVVSSADPKNSSISSSQALFSGPPYHREKPIVCSTKKSKASQSGDSEQNEASRKTKKKKEKFKSKYEVQTAPEPPRIEDVEEFPNLAVASERRDRDRVESPTFRSKEQPQNNFKSSGKKSQIPVQLDLGGMLTALEKQQRSQNAKQSSRPVVFSVGAVPVLSKEATSGTKGHRFSQAKTPHNPLDSSAPLIKKGKQREVPKAKKPTSLKKIILKEREERKQQRLQENATSPAFASDDVQDVGSGADRLTLEQAPGGASASVCSIPAVDSESEEQPGAEIHKEAATCSLAPEGASCPKIHSRRFRDYCSQVLSKEVDACVTDLLKELVRFQDRMYQKDPVKAKTKRRLVLGLREVLKHLKLRKLKCVIISPNCEKIQSKGGLDDTLHTIIDYACEQNIPFVFALNRKALGRSLNKAVPVSVVGIFSYDGAQDQFHRMVELTVAAREAYKTMLENVHQELAVEPGPWTPAGQPALGPSCSAEDGPPASPRTEEPHYIEIWRKHLEAYSQCAVELEGSLEASTSQMMRLNL
ncbi:PREDICTED: selenocysteine insertion sequence-binding protein 2 [Miniopterus natalensis]|uniref:selenocysteine insertion sequence-binding protein 2 n=1 Tax=Miniopterus natalensis TaxID=291302 RepID=UPI0007A6AFDF|nr:PREDICTED: selenocysteine insertion sequence-binding protein 2 [Miniopterus natalensis]